MDGSNIWHGCLVLNQSQAVNAYNHLSTEQLISNAVIIILIISAFPVSYHKKKSFTSDKLSYSIFSGA